MTKHLSLLTIILSFFVFSYGQSYLGFSGGYTNPLAYENTSIIDDYFVVSDIESSTGYYVSAHLKDRLSKRFNLGFKISISNFKINYYQSVRGFTGVARGNLEYESYIVHTQLNFECRLIKNTFYFNFGPELAIPIYSYKKESGYNLRTNSDSSSFSSQRKNRDGNSNLRVFAGLTFEKTISKKMKLFANFQSNYNLWSMYKGIYTLDFRVGAGIQLLLPEFSLGKKRKKISDEEEVQILKKD